MPNKKTSYKIYIIVLRQITFSIGSPYNQKKNKGQKYFIGENKVYVNHQAMAIKQDKLEKSFDLSCKRICDQQNSYSVCLKMIYL